MKNDTWEIIHQLLVRMAISQFLIFNSQFSI
ncbi:hypothetical protein HMPREF9447_03579 [Bacteroides oleiciplenus YIT 12058]|uniref:Uncharacterized protein n=1 Tax=Bacteroides oleiciplenus YIT 12058 TaxID=742727 RepID=K9DWA5_9BACE|nr:hypothetical protein HMPREF9447_03579 [Bacteroides oleiciplenus YIT 12058]